LVSGSAKCRPCQAELLVAFLRVWANYTRK
jgi:hypothetical protein